MITLRKFFALTVSAAAVVACNNAPEETVATTDAQEVQEVEASSVYALNTAGDELTWVGYKTYTDGSHTGTIQVSEGSFTVEGDQIVGGTFVIDMNSIDNKDLTDEEKKGKLVGHLKSPDFFAVEQYPTATFTITSVEPATGAEAGATHIIKGNLKMRETEKNISIPANISMSENGLTVSTPEFVIDRTEWGVQYGAEKVLLDMGMAKENAIANNIKLKLELKAEKA